MKSSEVKQPVEKQRIGLNLSTVCQFPSEWRKRRDSEIAGHKYT